MNNLIIIPARYDSQRLPKKCLLDINNRPIIWYAYQNAINTGIETIIATDSELIFNKCKSYNMNVIMTSKHNTPTSRIYEVSTKIEKDYYIFLGADEILIDSIHIKKIINFKYDIVNAITKIDNKKDILDISNIKVVINNNNELIYTCRNIIPYRGDLYYKFVGLGKFSKESLRFYNNTKQSNLEKIEQCDLLRFIENHKIIKCIDIKSNNISIDTMEDYIRVKRILENR